MNELPRLRPHQLRELPPTERWLINELWGHQAVGIIGGEPKCCKSFLALDMAVSVASGQSCLGRYTVANAGCVLLFAAEDALHIVRERLLEICCHRGLSLEALDIWVVTAPVVRLDREDDRERLRATLAAVNPSLLVLDPFVRMHRIDENVCSEVAPLLAFLRELQRQHGCAVALVHHARKGGAAMREGQALRGSSELHAWGDSNLYLRRNSRGLTLSIEHRAASSQRGIPIELRTGGGIALVAGEPDGEQQQRPPAKGGRCSPHDRVLDQLRAAATPLKTRPLRERCQMKAATLTRALAELEAVGTVMRSEQGWMLRECFPEAESPQP